MAAMANGGIRVWRSSSGMNEFGRKVREQIHIHVE